MFISLANLLLGLGTTISYNNVSYHVDNHLGSTTPTQNVCYCEMLDLMTDYDGYDGQVLLSYVDGSGVITYSRFINVVVAITDAQSGDDGWVEFTVYNRVPFNYQVACDIIYGGYTYSYDYQDCLTYDGFEFIKEFSHLSQQNVDEFKNDEFSVILYFQEIPNSIYSIIDENSQLSYENGYQTGRYDGLTEGEAKGYVDGYNDGLADGKDIGYITGKNDGIREAGTYSFSRFFGAIADVPILYIRNLLGFDVFGISAINILMTMITGCIVLYLLRKVIF